MNSHKNPKIRERLSGLTLVPFSATYKITVVEDILTIFHLETLILIKYH